MARVCLSLVGMVALGALALAQPVNEPPTQTEPTVDPVPVIKLTVSAVPRLPPALKYQLLPDPRELTGNNAAPLWLRASQLLNQQRPGLTDQHYNWGTTATPLKDLPRKEVHLLLDKYRTALQLAEAAARCNRCDWEFPRLGPHDLHEVLLPEIQSLRALANVLALQARLEMAEGNLDKALHTLQTGFALAKHVGEAPTSIQALVGIAIAAVMAGKVEELIQLADAPNLYWALTMLPGPFLDERKPFNGEMSLLYRTVPLFQEVPTTPMKPEQAQALFESALREAGRLTNSPKPSVQERLFVTGQVALIYPDAKRALIAQGLSSEQVEAMPSVQAVALYLHRKFQYQLDDWLKWIYVPYWQGVAGMEKADKQLRASPPRSVEEVLLGLSLPAMFKVRTAVVRIDRQLAGLRCVEAIRLYAATHEGRLPETLGAITDVPLPIDPITGKSFDLCYRLQGDQAVFEVPPPPFHATSSLLGRRYVLTRSR